MVGRRILLEMVDEEIALRTILHILGPGRAPMAVRSRGFVWESVVAGAEQRLVLVGFVFSSVVIPRRNQRLQPPFRGGVRSDQLRDGGVHLRDVIETAGALGQVEQPLGRG